MRFNRRREFSSSHSRIQTQGETGSLGTDQLYAQKVREAPRGPPRPAGQAHAFMLFVNGVRRYESATMPLFFPPSLAGRSGLSAEPVHLELFLRTVSRPSTPTIQKPDLPAVQRHHPRT